MVKELKVDLHRMKFDDSSGYLFPQAELSLKNKNFIFGKNGSGKSTLTSSIMNQFKDDYEVKIFQGFEQTLGENKNLNAFFLSDTAAKDEGEIRIKEGELKQKLQQLQSILKQTEKPEGTAHNLYAKLEKSRENHASKNRAIENFCRQAASEIKNQSNPQISDTSYDIRKFKKEITKGKYLQDIDVKKYEETLLSGKKSAIKMEFKNSNLQEELHAVNKILTTKVKEQVVIHRLDTPKKIKFAEEGYKIHSHDDEQICAFCGNIVDAKVLSELKTYFSTDDIKKFRKILKDKKEFVQEKISELKSLKINLDDFYPIFKGRVNDEREKLVSLITKQKEFWNEIKKALDDKDEFSLLPSLQLEIPKELEFAGYNDIVDENEEYTANLETEKVEAQNVLRFHRVKILLEKFMYDTESARLEELKKIYEQIEKDFTDKKEEAATVGDEISVLNDELAVLQPKMEKKAIKNINEKLRSRVAWQLDFAKNDDIGYYNIKEGDTHRGVDKLSTGERNIITFLYFIEKLEESGLSSKPKIIVFDDPMNSNDDTFQYLIITELCRLYQNKEIKKFNLANDFLVILTHNIHFYLNIRPRDYKTSKLATDENGNKLPKMIESTIYDKANFYHLRNHQFILIESSKDDLMTSYSALWQELKDLYECGHKTSMLNAMRRIIETFTTFNSLDNFKFYADNAQYKKLFDVNSHGLEDLSSEIFTEEKDEIRDAFVKIFEDNGFDNYVKDRWKY